MFSRRKFIRATVAAAMGLYSLQRYVNGRSGRFVNLLRSSKSPVRLPVVISTWFHGLPANQRAWEILVDNGRALDAVEQGVRISEANPEINSVGYGGLPDREGNVTLDASIMDETGNCGSVVCLRNIMHPVSVARLVMEKTPHVMLAGQGALHFALDQGFKEEDLLTPKARSAWEQWLIGEAVYREEEKNHDTIGMLAMDIKGNLSGACTTSGLAFKMPGRVGDSPIIGAGLFVDNQVGAAVATGEGELIMKMAGTFLIVELMRNGITPQKACQMAVSRVNSRQEIKEYHQVGFIALNKAGETGACALRPGFQYALCNNNGNTINPSPSLYNE